MTADAPDGMIRLRYRIQAIGDPYHVANLVAGEMSSGTFVRVPGETAGLTRKHRAQVTDVQLLGRSSTAELASRQVAGESRIETAIVDIELPAANVGPNLPTLMTTILGNISELGKIAGLRLLDVSLPDSYRLTFPGPRYGVDGTRRLTGVLGRPLFGTIIKPSIGLSPAQTADLVRDLAIAGLDFIKDDELMADPQHSPLRERVSQVMHAVDEAADRTGRKIMYAFNISADADTMRAHHDYVVRAGGSCVMVSLNSVGLAATQALCRDAAVPVHGHRNGWGMLTRHDALGMSFSAYQKIWRLAGIDHLHTGGIGSKFWESDESVVASIRACLTPMADGDEILPVLSSGQWAGQLPETYRRVGSWDFLYLCGGGILAHPDGPSAGVRSLAQAYQAAEEGVSLGTFARDHSALRGAIDKFGPLVYG